MRIRIILCLTLLVTWVAACSAKSKEKAVEPKQKEVMVCAPWKAPSEEVYKELGKSLATVLMRPQEVKCYSVAWQDSVKAGQLEPYFAQDSLICKLSKEEIAVLQYNLLTNSKSYENDSIVVMSPYRPVLDFQFRNKKEVAHVIISLSDFSWSVLYDDKKQFTHNINSEAIERFCKYYLSTKK